MKRYGLERKKTLGRVKLKIKHKNLHIFIDEKYKNKRILEYTIKKPVPYIQESCSILSVVIRMFKKRSRQYDFSSKI